MKLNLIIDGNYLLNRASFLLNKETTFREDFPVLLRKDFNKLIKIFNYNNIYFVSDSKNSWRKKIYNDYKANRKKDSTMDWDFIFQTYDEFKEELKTNKLINFNQIEYLEGDDLIGYIVSESNANNISTMIVTNDADIKQLLNFDISKEWINFIYNYKITDERLYLPLNYDIYFTNIKQNNNLFDSDFDTDFKNEFISFIRGKKIDEVVSEKILFCKIVSGDRGDNIESCYTKIGKTGAKRGIGDTGSEKIYDIYKDIYKDTINFNEQQFIENLSEIINFDKKINNDEVLLEVKTNIKRNLKLIKLDKDLLPSQLLSELNKIKI